MKELAVIGAGISGLLTADYLSSSFRVTIYEKENEIGGIGRSIDCSGHEIERYNHFFSRSDSAFIGLLSELGLSDRIFWKNLGQAFVLKDRFIPLSNLLDVLNYPVLGFSEKMQLAGLILSCNYPEKEIKKENVRSWVKRKCPGMVFENFFLPFFKFKFSEIEDINAVYLRARIREQKNNRIGYIRGGSKVLFERLRERAGENNIAIMLNTAVSSVSRCAEGKWQVNIPEPVRKYDVVVSCIPFIETLRLNPLLFNPSAVQNKKIRYLCINSFLVELDRPLKDGFWLYMVELEDAKLGVVIEATAFTGKTFVYFPVYGKRLISDDEAAQVFEDFLCALKKININFKRDWIKNKFFFRDMNTEPVLSEEYLSLLRDNPVFEESFYVSELLAAGFYLKSYNSAAAVSKRMARIIIKDHAGNNPS